jgi:hypothetical protein
MTLSTEQILQLAQSSDPFTAELILTIDKLADKVTELSARVKQLEDRQQAPVAKIRAV